MKARISLLVFTAVIICTQSIAKSNLNPFAKAVVVNIGLETQWNYNNKTATKTASGESSETFYHLFFDQKQLRLRLTSGTEDSEASAKSFRKFAIDDVLIDGKRLPLFHWCLYNQEEHARFLQQGLSVKQDICVNSGDKGTFIMQLNEAAISALTRGKKLSIVLKPFRSQVVVNYDLGDFSTMVAKLQADEQALIAAKEAAEKKSEVIAMCDVIPPEEFSTLEKIEYPCDNDVAKATATGQINFLVSKLRAEHEHQNRIAAEREKKRQAELASKKRKEDARKMKLEQARIESAAVAASLVRQKKLNETITKKMLVLCNKKWAKGEHRCFCEKYIEYAPASIKSDSSCPT